MAVTLVRPYPIAWRFPGKFRKSGSCLRVRYEETGRADGGIRLRTSLLGIWRLTEWTTQRDFGSVPGIERFAGNHSGIIRDYFRLCRSFGDEPNEIVALSAQFFGKKCLERTGINVRFQNGRGKPISVAETSFGARVARFYRASSVCFCCYMTDEPGGDGVSWAFARGQRGVFNFEHVCGSRRWN